MELLAAILFVLLILVVSTPWGKSAVYVDPYGGWSGSQIEALLQEHNISISHRHPGAILFGPPDLFFYVEDEDYANTIKILSRAGVPLRHKTAQG